jgi:hypothetical protein
VQLPADGWPPLPDLTGAACREPGVDRAWFFPDRGENASLGKKVCAGCAVSGPCLDYALSCGGTLDGIWSGTTRSDRRRLRRSVLARHPDDSDTDIVDSVVAVELEPAVTNGHVPEPGAAETVGTRACVGCGADLSDRREATRWCSETCRSRYRKRSASAAGSQPAAVTIAQDRRNGHRVGPDTRTSPADTSWLSVAGSFVDHGFALSMMVGSTAIVITRSEPR